MAAPATATVALPAPAFEEEAVFPDSSIKTVKLSDYKGKWVVLLFYPLDFTFVCPTEVIAFSDRADEFKKLNTEILAVSVDSVHTHIAFNETPRNKGGLGGVQIPLVADLNKKMCVDYDVLLASGHSLRGLFIIDPEGTLQQVTKNNAPVGRSVDETLRLLQAFQFVATHGDQVCPVNWKPGQATITEDPAKSKAYFASEFKE
jgi:peroxiredoxin 2/4